MKPTLSFAAREIGHWRHFFRTRDAALRRAEPGSARRRHTAGETGDTEYAPTEWAETQWPDTNIDPRPR